MCIKVCFCIMNLYFIVYKLFHITLYRPFEIVFFVRYIYIVHVCILIPVYL